MTKFNIDFNEEQLGLALTQLQKELLSFTRYIDSRKQALKDLFASSRKYSIGLKFDHPKYNVAIIVDVYIDERDKGYKDYIDVSIYDDPYYFSNIKSFYDPIFMYKCEVNIEGLGITTTNIPEWEIDECI